MGLEANMLSKVPMSILAVCYMDGMDYLSNNNQKYTVNSKEVCAQKCQDSSSCKLFTYASARKLCYLHLNKARPVPNSEVIAGIMDIQEGGTVTALGQGITQT